MGLSESNHARDENPNPKTQTLERPRLPIPECLELEDGLAAKSAGRHKEADQTRKPQPEVRKNHWRNRIQRSNRGSRKPRPVQTSTPKAIAKAIGKTPLLA